MFMKCRNYGFDALIVKCADIFDNIGYFIQTSGYEELANYLLEKCRLFLDISENILGKEELYSALKDKVFRANQLMDAHIKNLNKTRYPRICSSGANAGLCVAREEKTAWR